MPAADFYTLQLFNQNGTMLTQHDVQEWFGSEPDPTRGLPIVYIDSGP